MQNKNVMFFEHPLITIENFMIAWKPSTCFFGGEGRGAKGHPKKIPKLNKASGLCIQVVDDLMLRRFLRARDLDVEKAAKMFMKYLDWKRTFLPKGFVSEAEIQYDISHNKLFVGGIDKKGRPIMVVFGGRHFQNPKPGGVDEFKRMFLPAS